jgi:hypothetical protein
MARNLDAPDLSHRTIVTDKLAVSLPVPVSNKPGPRW